MAAAFTVGSKAGRRGVAGAKPDWLCLRLCVLLCAVPDAAQMRQLGYTCGGACSYAAAQPEQNDDYRIRRRASLHPGARPVHQPQGEVACRVLRTVGSYAFLGLAGELLRGVHQRRQPSRNTYREAWYLGLLWVRGNSEAVGWARLPLRVEGNPAIRNRPVRSTARS